MTLIFNEEFAINPQSAQSGGGGSSIDWSKIFYRTTDNPSNTDGSIQEGYYTNFGNKGIIINQTAVTSSGHSGSNVTECVNFSQPFEINAEFIPGQLGGAIFGNAVTNQYFSCPSAEFQNGQIWTAVSTDGTTWTNQFTFTSSEIPIAINETYIINHKWDGTNYTVTVKKGDTVVKKSETLTGTPFYNSNATNTNRSLLCFGGCAGQSSLRFQYGKIFVGNTYIKQNGVLVWGCEGK